MPVYAVTGASGHLGRFAIEQLLARGVPPSHVVAMVRDRGKAASLAGRGVQVREADYSRPETLGAALAGVNRLLLVSSSELGQLAAQHSNVITAARMAGVARIAYTSMLNADDSTSPLAGEHRDTERVLREAGVPYTLLRNGYYTEVYIADLDGQNTTTSELLQAHLPASHVVKAFNTMFFRHLATLGRPHEATDRSALPIASDDDTAKTTVTAFLDAIGYDTYDAGPLSEGWRLQPGTIAYAYGTNGSFEHPQPAGAEQLTSLLAQAKRYRDR